MPKFYVTLIANYQVSGSLEVTADSTEAAKAEALERYDEAEWPVSETGQTIDPGRDWCVAWSVTNVDSAEQEFFEEEPPYPAPQSAAPDLLTALIELEEYADRYACETQQPEDGGCWASIRRARAAIARATGQE